MSVTRRGFVKVAGMGAVAAGMPWLRSMPSAAAEARTDRYADWLFIDTMSGFSTDPAGLAAIERSGLTTIYVTMGGSGEQPNSYEDAIQAIVLFRSMIDQNPDRLKLVLRTDDILEAKRTGRMGVILNFQNGSQLDRDIDNVEFFYNMGIRQIIPTYNRLNALGAGCTARVDTGLSHFGVAVIEKMNELGMVVDLAHSGFKTTMDALDVSKSTPVFSHNNCSGLYKHPRNKTDEEIKKLAARGGVIGMSTVNFFVGPKEANTLDDLIDHFVHVAELVGVDHLAVGSDSGVAGWRAMFADKEAFDAWAEPFEFHPSVDVRWPPFIEEIDVPEKFFIIADRLLERGFSTGEVRRIMGENWMRIYREVLG
jgi:membrane dipeptidase